MEMTKIFYANAKLFDNLKLFRMMKKHNVHLVIENYSGVPVTSPTAWFDRGDLLIAKKGQVVSQMDRNWMCYVMIKIGQ